ncbi:MAG: nickel-dependent lactate racemase [Tepidanaerobacteraceae bacterium]|jgi:nickel-dependent lactate racemase|nr:nickel-dependent lactate racemase [Tepidanaerobacteraceae bacterium]
MRTFNLKYGKSEVKLDISEENVLSVLEAKKIEAVRDETQAVISALNNPIQSPAIEEIVKPGDRVAVIASDITRSVKSRVVVPAVISELNRCGIADEDITIVVATGTHRGHTVEEHEYMFGNDVVSRIKIVDHNSRDEKSLAFIGNTTRGTPVYVNRIVAEADRVILTGGIMYHSMAGFGGGRKSICPGVCGFNTIQKNHKLMLNPIEKGGGIDPRVGLGKTAENPMAADMAEIADMVKPDFLVNVILNDDGNMAKVVAGDYKAAFEEGCDFVRDSFSVRVSETADALILSCGGFPKDIDLYQATKAIENAMHIANDGGVVVLLAECPDGIGHDGFYHIITGFGTRLEREESLWDEFTIAKAVGYILTLGMERFDVILVSKMDEKLVRDMGMIPASGVDEAVELARHKLGNDFKAYVIPHASTTVPVLEK